MSLGSNIINVNLNRLNQLHVRNCLNASIKYVSTQTQAVETVKEKKSDLFRKVMTKKPQRPPFMKNMFLGKFDAELLGFPEVLNKEEQRVLDEKVSVVDNYITEINNKVVDKIPGEVFEQLKSLRLFGLQAPEIAGGLELNETENCRMLESIGKDSSLVFSTIMHQYFGVQSVLTKCEKSVREKYLKRLSSGESIGAFCLLEEDTLDPDLMTTAAKLSEDGKFYVRS